MFSPSKIISLLISLILIGTFLLLDLPGTQFQVSFLDIGQGDAIYIRTPDDYHAMIDSGPSMNVLERLSEVMPRYSRTLDLLIITHPHADHINGFVEILKRYDVRRLMIVGTPSYNPYYRKILTLVDDIEIIYARADHDIKLGSYVYLDVVWPTEGRIEVEFENKNDASIAVRIFGPDGSFLLTGDAEHDEEREILESGFDLSAEIYKAGHHGSKTASGDDFLDAVGASIVVIQSGEDNDFGHPHKEALENYFEREMVIRRNDKEGRVDFIYAL